MNPFLNYLSYSIDDFTPFYVNQQEQADFVGIRKAVESDYLSIYSKHFSTIGVGFKVVVPTPTDVNSLETTPNEYELAQNYPNPFNPSTTISYNLPNSGFTKLSVYNSLGQEVQSLINDNQSAGTHTVNFNASNLPSGMYFYSLTSGNFTQTNKMILMK
ncbi:MAG: T9SS type A sorting domain-containing protein [Ignavibacteriales bacterium]|nr:T9SS type A sorting domain-containing protein [Ignavibacteriales bacterium]